MRTTISSRGESSSPNSISNTPIQAHLSWLHISCRWFGSRAEPTVTLGGAASSALAASSAAQSQINLSKTLARNEINISHHHQRRQRQRQLRSRKTRKCTAAGPYLAQQVSSPRRLPASQPASQNHSNLNRTSSRAPREIVYRLSLPIWPAPNQLFSSAPAATQMK